ncbi:MAG: DUF3276 family protein [Candidatus Roizmanbacteria bacterium]
MDSKTKLDSKNIKCGYRTYFFDTYEAKNKSKYLVVTESRFIKEGEPYKRSSIILFKEDLEKFKDELKKITLD